MARSFLSSLLTSSHVASTSGCWFRSIVILVLQVNGLMSGWILFYRQAAAADHVMYQFRLVSGPAVEVSAEFKGRNTGITTLALTKDWGGITNDGTHVKDAVATDANGQRLEVEQLNATEWTVKHQPDAEVQFRYLIPQTGDRPPVRGNDYRTFVGSDIFQCIGHLGVVMPQLNAKASHLPEKSSDSESDIEFTVRFDDFEKQSWKVVSSFGNGPGPFTFVGKPEEFLHRVILAGDIQVVDRTVNEQHVAVAVSGHHWRFSPDELADAVVQIVSIERDFFQDHSDPWFLVTLTPTRNSAPNSFSLGGTALQNAFALFCSDNLALSAADPGSLNAYSLLAHEYFHNWNGMKIPTAGEDPSTYWFSEGFTNYYARRMLLAAELISSEQYAQMLSEAVAKHDDNPFRGEKNERIRAEFWTNRQIQELPYSRGELVAVVLDQHIRARSNGKQSLDDVMRELLRSPIEEAPLNSDLLFERIGNWVEPEVLAAIRNWVMDGVIIDLPETLDAPSLKLTNGMQRQYDPNFDMDASRAQGKITGVAEDSEAYKAGLRNEQALRRFSVQHGDGKTPPQAEIEVLDNGEVKTFRYTAIGPPKAVRRYVPAEG